MRTRLKHLKIKTTTIRIHTLIGKAEEGAGEGRRLPQLSMQGPSRSLNPPHMVVPCVQDLECHDNVDPIRLRDIDNFILKLFNSLHMFCLKQPYYGESIVAVGLDYEALNERHAV